MTQSGPAVSTSARPSEATDVALWTTYAYRVGTALWGPYSLEYASGMAAVLMHLGETGVALIRTTAYRRADGSAYRVRTEVEI